MCTYTPTLGFDWRNHLEYLREKRFKVKDLSHALLLMVQKSCQANHPVIQYNNCQNAFNMPGGLQDFFPPCEVSKVFKYSFAIIQRLRLIFDVEQQDLSDCGPAAAGNGIY